MAWTPRPGQLDLLCNEAHLTHARTHTSPAEFITALHYPLLYRRNVIPRFGCSAIMIHYTEVTEGVDR